jgi:hypothetical protein
MDKRGDNEKNQDMPNGDVKEKPLSTCQMYHVEKLTNKKTEDECPDDEIKLVKGNPILSAIPTNASFEETLDDISK